MSEGIRLFVGGHGQKFHALIGDRCFSPAHPVNTLRIDHPAHVTGLLDSGAFSDKPECRLTPAGALDRQLRWEIAASAFWGASWRSSYLVSYDRLIDETWVAGERYKQRWTVAAADRAVEETIEAARYLASQRAQLWPRRLVLACQGVDAMQYDECVQSVLRVASHHDVIGLGGWCILGRYRSWLPTFWATLYRILPQIEAAGVRQVHIFGVLYLPALGGLLWLADRHHLSVSTDSSAPLRSACGTTAAARRKSGARADDWQGNVEWWQRTLRNLRSSQYYRQPPQIPAARQHVLFA